MLNQALGMIETYGLTAAVEAADAACKSADVELVGYELAKGGGLVTVKVLGQVGAVKAAVDAATAAAGGIGRVVSTSVIPRPNEQLDVLVFNQATVGHEGEAPVPAPEPVQEPEPQTPRASRPRQGSNKENKEEEK